MNYVFLMILFFITIASCNEKNESNNQSEELTSIEAVNEEMKITLLEDNFHLVIIESEDDILNSIKQNIQEKEALGLTKDEELSEGEAAIIGTIAASFSVAFGAIVGVSIHKSIENNKSLKQLDTRPSLTLSRKKMIAVPDEVSASLGVKNSISEKELAESTLDKLDEGKSLAFESKDAADNVQNLLKENFPSIEKEMRVIEVNGRFHLVSWQKMFTSEDKPFLVMEVKTDFTENTTSLAEKIATKDFILVVDPKNIEAIKDIENFTKTYEKDILAQKQEKQTSDGKDIYILTNKKLQENLDALTNLTKSNEKIELETISAKKYPDSDDGTTNNKNDRKQITHVFGEAIKTKIIQIEQFERVEKTLTEYLKKNPNNNGVRELKDITKDLKEKLQETVKDLNPDNTIKFDKKMNLNSFDLEQKHLDAFQKHYTDPQLYRLYRESTRIIRENKLDKKDGGLFSSLLEIDLKVNKPATTKGALDPFNKRALDGLERDLAPLFQSITRLSMPLDQDWLKKYPWFQKAFEAIKKYVTFVDKG